MVLGFLTGIFKMSDLNRKPHPGGHVGNVRGQFVDTESLGELSKYA
jgi:hypothetical protein